MIYTGDLRTEFGRDAARLIDRAIRYGISRRLEKFYVTLITKWGTYLGKRALRTRAIIDTRKPHAWLGTVAIYVDAKKGCYTLLHALPKDIPVDGVEFSEQGVEQVFNSAVMNRSPVIYG